LGSVTTILSRDNIISTKGAFSKNNPLANVLLNYSSIIPTLSSYGIDIGSNPLILSKNDPVVIKGNYTIDNAQSYLRLSNTLPDIELGSLIVDNLFSSVVLNSLHFSQFNDSQEIIVGNVDFNLNAENPSFIKSSLTISNTQAYIVLSLDFMSHLRGSLEIYNPQSQVILKSIISFSNGDVIEICRPEIYLYALDALDAMNALSKIKKVLP